MDSFRWWAPPFLGDLSRNTPTPKSNRENMSREPEAWKASHSFEDDQPCPWPVRFSRPTETDQRLPRAITKSEDVSCSPSSSSGSEVSAYDYDRTWFQPWPVDNDMQQNQAAANFRHNVQWLTDQTTRIIPPAALSNPRMSERRRRQQTWSRESERVPLTAAHAASLTPVEPPERKPAGCGFCRKNGETPEFFMTHTTRGPWNRVICPVLRQYKCSNCGATGDEAHTASYCPSPKI